MSLARTLVRPVTADSNESVSKKTKQNDLTVLGKTVVVVGILQGEEDLTVYGRIEGQITLSKKLTVMQSGLVKAEITVHSAVISGIVIGNIIAEESVLITSSGQLLGNIQSPRVVIVAGARVRGEVNMGPAPVGKVLSEDDLTKEATATESHPLSLAPHEETWENNTSPSARGPFMPPLALRRLRKKIVVRDGEDESALLSEESSS